MRWKPREDAVVTNSQERVTYALDERDPKRRRAFNSRRLQSSGMVKTEGVYIRFGPRDNPFTHTAAQDITRNFRSCAITERLIPQTRPGRGSFEEPQSQQELWN